jgi:F-type H+-transporting ATPase subunit b
MFKNFLNNLSLCIATGGLFDFDATLPFLAIQFLILMFILNNILYNPLLNTINKRNDYISSTLTKGADSIDLFGELKNTCLLEIVEFRNLIYDADIEWHKRFETIINTRLDKMQDASDFFIEKLDLRLAQEKEKAWHKLEDELQILEIGKLIQDKILSTK